jgi:hypothetical protein
LLTQSEYLSLPFYPSTCKEKELQIYCNSLDKNSNYIDIRLASCYNITMLKEGGQSMGKRKKKPTNRIDWLQAAVDGLVSLVAGLIVMLVDKLIS